MSGLRILPLSHAIVNGKHVFIRLLEDAGYKLPYRRAQRFHKRIRGLEAYLRNFGEKHFSLMVDVDMYNIDEVYDFVSVFSDELYEYWAIDKGGGLGLYELPPEAKANYWGVSDTEVFREIGVVRRDENDQYFPGWANTSRKIVEISFDESGSVSKAFDLREFSRLNLERRNTTEKFAACLDWSGTDWGLALAGECGEVLNVIKKLNRLGSDSSQELAGKLGDELADVVTYCDLIAHRYNIDLSDAIIQKFNAVSDRVDSGIRLSSGGNDD